MYMIILYDRGAVTVFASNILYSKNLLYAFKCVLETFQNNNLVTYLQYQKSVLNTDFKRLFLGIHEKRGL